MTPAKDPNAMDIDRLSVEESKEYMKKGQCFGCGKTGHIKRDCPNKQTRNDVPQKGGKAETKQSLATRIRALMKEADEEEANEAIDELEKEGFA